MPPQAVDTVASAPPFDHLPLTIDQTSSRASALIMLVLLVPALLVGLVPTALLVAFASSSLGVAADHPGAAAQVLLGIGLWTVLFVLPAKRIVQRFGIVRRIHIDTDAITVNERGLFGARKWQAPLSEYSGIARHLRSTLSGLRHELILVHREPRKSVLLHSADLASPPTIDQAKRLLGLPEIQPRELYKRRTFHRPVAAAPGPIVARVA
jgi:hypothetical protein